MNNPGTHNSYSIYIFHNSIDIQMTSTMKKIVQLLLLILVSSNLFSQQDCMGTESYIVNPLPQNGGYAPGTVVEYCVTFNNWNTAPGTNWLEGFDMTLGAGWVPGSVNPTTFPPNAGGNLTGGQWLWVPNTFNGNPASAGGAGNQFGPGFFFDEDEDGNANNDWGDFGTGPWTFCFEVTVGAASGASLSLQVAPVSDGFAGSWLNPGCGGYYNFQISPGNTVLGCLTPPVISLQSTQDASCNGANDGQLTVSVAGGAAPFSYTINGILPTLFGGGAFYANLVAGNYAVVCTDNDGCASNTLNIIVNENSVVQNNTVAFQDVLCFGNSTGSFDINSQNGAQPYTYTLGAQVNQTGQFANLPAGNYVVQVTDANGCSNFHNVSINQNSQMTPQIVSVTDVNCFGESTGDCEISCIGGIAPYTYSFGAIANLTGIFTDIFPTGNHILTVTDDNGCQAQQNIAVNQPTAINIWQPFVIDVDCFGNTNGEITVFANGGVGGYTYQLGPNINALGVFTGLGVGNYQIMVEDANGCQFLTPLITVNGPQLPLTAQLVTNEPTCHGGANGEIAANISGGTLPYSLVWNTVPIQNTSPAINLTAGLYQVNITDANGCQYQTQTPLSQPNNIIVATSNLSTICFGQEVTLASTQQNAVLPFTTEWTNNQNGNINFNGDNVSPPLTTLYTATLTDANGCQGQTNHAIIVNPLPNPGFSVSSTTGCDRYCIDFTVDNPNPNHSYTWTFGDASISFNGDTINHCYADSGLYTVFLKATTNLGCVDSLRKPNLIRINKTPTASFVIGPSEISFIDEPDFQFDNLSQDADVYYWNLGDLTLTQEDSPQHRYISAGNYCVKLITVANYTTGIPTCIDSLEKCLEILPLSVCFVPSSFSPNDDEINDIFAAKGSRITDFELVIHNRWGEQVYRSFDINNGWDGRYGDSNAPIGNYLYTVYYRDSNYRPHLLKGNVVLLR